MKRVGLLIFKDHVVMCGDVVNSARLWSRRGYRADVFAYDTGRFHRPVVAEKDVRFRLVRTLYARLLPHVRPLKKRLRVGGPSSGERPGGDQEKGPATLRQLLFRAGVLAFRSLQMGEYVAYTVFNLLGRRYRLVIVFDTPSLVAARLVNLVKRTPYAYHSRELLLTWDLKTAGQRFEKVLERHCHRRAAFTIVQDRPRGELLARDNGGAAEEFLIVPNSPMGTYEGGPSDRLRRAFDLPSRTPIVLYAGTIDETMMVKELVDSMSDWPAGAALVLHGDIETEYRPLLEESTSRHRGRVFFSSPTLQLDELDELFAGADAGLAFYRPHDDNSRYAGHAAGKIFNFMKAGVPVICNDLPGMKELLDENGCGITVPSFADTGRAVATLLGDREGYRRRCLDTFARFEFGRACNSAIDRMEADLGRRGGSG